MKMKLKKVYTLVLALILVLSVGCGQSTEDGKEQTQAEQTNQHDDSQGADIPTYTIATVRWTDAWPTDYLESGVMKELEEKHNININWEVYYSSDWEEQKSLLLASGDLPDAFFGSICLNDSDLTINKNRFLELTDLIETNMPNLAKIFEEDPVMKAMAMNREGEIYSLVKKLPLRPTVANSMYINKEWLDNLGLEVPTTYEELADVLITFANEDADGDGDKNNEIPYTNAGSLLGDMNNLLAPFRLIGSRAGNYMQLDKNENPSFVPTTEEYKIAVKWAHELYKNGALDPEYFTQDASMATAKRTAEGGAKTGLVFAWTADSEMGTNAEQFILCEALEGPDGERYVEADPTFLDIANRELVISKDCNQPEKLLQWADEFYTDLVSLQTYYGSIPNQIKDNGDGTYEVLLPSDGTSFDTSAWSNSMRDFGPKYMSEDFQDKITLPETEGDGVKLLEDQVNAKYAKNVVFPVVKYTEEQAETMAYLATDIYKYIESQYAMWVVEGGIDETWDGYIEQLNAMGLEELLEIQKDAYQAYINVE